VGETMKQIQYFFLSPFLRDLPVVTQPLFYSSWEDTIFIATRFSPLNNSKRWMKRHCKCFCRWVVFG